MTLKDYRDIDNLVSSISVLYRNIELKNIVRNEIVYQIRRSKNQGTPKVAIDKKLKKRLVAGFFLTCKGFFLRKKVWIFSNADRRKIIGEYYVDRVASGVSEIYENEVLYIENNSIRQHVGPTSDTIFSEAILQILTVIIPYFIKAKKVKVTGDVNSLEREYGFDVTKLINKLHGQFYAMSLLLLFKKKPKIVFMAYPFGYLGYILKFKEKKIPIIELQHGIIYAEHPSYNSSIEFSLHPDYIFTYGENDRSILSDLNFLPSKKIFSVGSYMLSYYKSIQLIENKYLDDLKERFNNKKIAVLTATLIDLQEIIELANELANQYNDFVFLVLPRKEVDIDFNIRENVEIIDVNKTSIYELLNLCKVHITNISTCALEALFFEKKSLVYEKCKGDSFFRRNYGNINNLEYFSSVQEFKEALDIPFNLNDNNIDVLWKDDFSKNTIEALKEIGLNNV